jgi:glycosyltransferase involved in cell wall biosynthesis
MVVVHNPVDLQRLQTNSDPNDIRREIGVCETTPLVGMIAHLTPWKGHDVFLETAQQVARSVPEARFLVVGGQIYTTHGHTGYDEHLTRRVAQLGLTDKVFFLGVRDDVPEILKALDVIVHSPTSPEPFGRVLAEAMAAARPVVAVRSGGIPEIVEDGETGYLTGVGDVDALSAAVVRLLLDRPLRDRLGSAGRRRAQRMFGIDAHADRVMSEYLAVLGRSQVA